MGTETQEPDAQGVATSSVSNKVAETQETTTHSVAETQEPAIAETQEPATHSVDETQEPAIAATQKPATAETQEPTADIEIDIHESEVQGAATLLSLHQEAETQESTTIPAATPQQPEATMASVLQENEFLKSELKAYKQELARAKEAYEKELNLYTLARTTTLSEETTESLCKEYMCCQCGDVYHQEGYKVIQVPVS
jgi:hypothetical protein